VAGVQDYCTHANIRSGSFESQGGEEPANALAMMRPGHHSPTQISTTMLENHCVAAAGNQLAVCGLDNEVRTRELLEEVLEYLPFRGREELRHITVEDIDRARQILCTVLPRAQGRTSYDSGSHDHGHPTNLRTTYVPTRPARPLRRWEYRIASTMISTGPSPLDASGATPMPASA
jgi:hypothetical protein